MNKENQIEEMAEFIFEILPIDLIHRKDAKILANHLYNADWRKQREGEWVKAMCSEKNGDSYCSECKHFDWSDRKYCSNCGAKMKGSEGK